MRRGDGEFDGRNGKDHRYDVILLLQGYNMENCDTSEGYVSEIALEVN